MEEDATTAGGSAGPEDPASTYPLALPLSFSFRPPPPLLAHPMNRAAAAAAAAGGGPTPAWQEAALDPQSRAVVGVAASAADWSKRIRDMQYADYEDHTVGSHYSCI